MLKKLIAEDLIKSMKEKNQKRVSTLRLINSSIKDLEIDLRSKPNSDEISDTDILNILSKMIKQRNDSISQFRNGGRDDLADKEQSEVDVLSKYKPEQLSEEDVSKLVDEVLSELGEVDMSQMGRIIGAVMAKGDGIDGSIVSKLVREKIS